MKIILQCIFIVLLPLMGAVAEQGKSCVDKKSVLHHEVLNINEVECFIQNAGPLGENPATGGNGFFYPAGQRSRSLVYSSGLWLAGKMNGELRTAASYYATEFQPGTILPDGTADDPALEKYRVYKYNRGDAIDAEAIAQGCPETVLGDQMCFCVYNDLGSHAGVFMTDPIGVEVQQTVFGYHRLGALGKTVFVRYRIINKNSDGLSLDSAYVGMWVDPDLGDAGDDAKGCIPEAQVSYVYNSDNYDLSYGSGPPTLALDWLQGPAVPSVGETAIHPDGSMLENHRFLPMTTSMYLFKRQDPNMESRIGATQIYNLMQGLDFDGNTIRNPLRNNAATTFPLDGDPVEGTGWLFSHVSSPRDVRMGSSCGPLTLAPGEAQDVWLALIVGDGKTELESIESMRYNDAVVQAVFDNQFDVFEVLPEPILDIATLDGELVLSWDSTLDTYQGSGYIFEGYNVWMAHGEEGPWMRMATFDTPDSIGKIYDTYFDEDEGGMVTRAVQFGRNTGIRHHLLVESDAVHGGALINGRDYWFAVTGYIYKSAGLPRVIETPIRPVRGVPQRPVMDVAYRSEYGDEVPVTVNLEIDANCQVTVVDPSKLTGHDYRITFSWDEAVNWLWSLTDVTAGERVLDAQPLRDDENFVPVHGLMIKLSSTQAGVKTIRETRSRENDYLDVNVWHSLNSDNSYFVNSEDGTLAGLSHFNEYIGHDGFKIIFNDEVNWAAYGYENGMITTVPFALYRDVFPNGPLQRMVPFLRAQNAPGIAHGTNAGIETLWGYPCSDFIYWMDSQEAESYPRFAAVCETLGEGALYPAEEDGSAQGYWVDFHGIQAYVLGPMVVADYNLSGAWPSAGTVIEVTPNRGYTEEVIYDFSTQGLAPRKDEAVAESRLRQINVFPNPYLGHNRVENSFHQQFVTFNNLPEANCTLRVFTISGQLVTVLKHNNGTPFERWDLLNSDGRPVASGMYIVHAKTAFGNKILKLGVVNRQLGLEF